MAGNGVPALDFGGFTVLYGVGQPIQPGTSVMKASVVGLFLTVALPVIAVAAPGDPGLSGDLKKLQGDWSVKAGPKRDIPVKLSVHGDDVSVDFASPLGIKVHAEGKVRIDESTTPKTIDWVGFSIVDGQDFPDILGIYELTDDTLRMVNGGPNDKRPKEFKKGDGALADVLNFTKVGVNVAKKDTAVNPTSAPISTAVVPNTRPVAVTFPVTVPVARRIEPARMRPLKIARLERRARRSAGRELAMASSRPSR